MNDGITMTIDEGAFTALERTIRELGTKAAMRIIDRAGRDVLKPMLSAARSRVTRRYGVLAKSLGIKTKRYRRSGTVVVVMGPRPGFRVPVVDRKTGKTRIVDPQRYSHLVERGTETTRKQPFMRPAWDGGKAEAMKTYAKAIIDGFDREAKKLVKKHGGGRRLP